MWVWRTSASSPASPLTAAADGEEVERASRRRRRAQREVAGGDRRREAVVERLRDPQRARARGPSPSRSASAWTRELAGVEQPEQLDRREHRRAQRAELLGAVLLDVPRVARTSRRPAARASARSASRRTRRRPARAARGSGSSTAAGSWTCSIVCRNTTASTSPGSPQVSTRSRSKLQVPGARSAAGRARAPPGWRRRRPRCAAVRASTSEP